MSVILTPSNQIRHNDPYQVRIFQYQDEGVNNQYYLSREVNSVYKMFSNRRLKGLEITSASIIDTNDLKINISSGVAIIDQTLIEFNDDMSVVYNDIDQFTLSDSIFAVFLSYQWLNTPENNPVNIKVVHVNKSTNQPESDFNPVKDKLLIGFISFDSNNTPQVNTAGHVKINNNIYNIGFDESSLDSPFESYMSNNILANFNGKPVQTKADFEAKAERVRRLTAGSGFVEWGKHMTDSSSVLNEGMWIFNIRASWRINNQVYYGSMEYGGGIHLGRHYLYFVGISKTTYPIININGYLLRLDGTNPTQFEPNNEHCIIKFPDPPSSPDQPYRQDLVFLEAWHEDISEKDVVFPYGNVQYGATTYTAPDGTSFNTVTITDLDIAQGYSAFGSWDTNTVGHGIKWSTLTDEQKKSFLSDQWNNCYTDGDKIIQVRYRIRVIPAPGSNEWNSYIPIPDYNAMGYNSSFYVYVRGKQDVFTEGGTYDVYRHFYPTGHPSYLLPYNEYGIYASYENANLSYNSYVIALPIALVARRNTGAFHSTYNPNGSAKFSGGLMWWEVTPTAPAFNIIGGNIEDTDSDGVNDLFQLYVEGDQTSEIKINYFIEVTGSTSNDGRYFVKNVVYDSDNDRTVITVSNEIPSTTFDGSLKSDFGYVKYCFDNAEGGTIESGVSGRPDGLYADEINEGDVKDLRNYALRITDYNRLLEKEFNKLLTGKLRGWEEIPVSLIYKGDVLYTGSVTTSPEFVKTAPERYSLYLITGGGIQLRSCQNSNANYRHLYENFFKSAMMKNDGIYVGFTKGSPSLDNSCKIVVGFLTSGETYTDAILSFVLPDKFPYFYKNLITCDIQGKTPDVSRHYALGAWNIFGDYGESFIPTDDFSATVDSTDTTKIIIAGNKTYVIKKNCRLFLRPDGSTASIANTLTVRIKSVSYDSTNDQTIVVLTSSPGAAGATLKASTCIASGQTGTVSDGNQVYIFKLSRKPKDANQVKVLIKKKDGTWFAYNNFEPISVYNSIDLQAFVNNAGGLDNEIRFNSYLNWIGVNITAIYSTLGYLDEEDFKQNTVIEVYYQTEANPLNLEAGNHSGYIVEYPDYLRFCGFGGRVLSDIFDFGKFVEYLGYGTNYKMGDYVPIKENPNKNMLYYPGYQVIKADFPTNIVKTGFGLTVLPILYFQRGRLRLLITYNEIIYDYEMGDIGWQGALYVTNYEATYTDDNGNVCIAGQKYVELPYFVCPEDKDV